MTKEQAVREFKDYYADLYIRKVDYWTAQLAWSEYVDNLCRCGRITQRQYDTWSNPFTYGKKLKPTKAMLERRVYG